MLTQKSLASTNLSDLTTQLEIVNSQFHSTIESELDKLKEKERQLQAALKLKTRQTLLSTMERELEIDNFYSDVTGNSTALMLTSSGDRAYLANNDSLRQSLDNCSLSPSKNGNFVSSAIAGYQTLNLSNLNKSIDVSDEGLRQSNAILDKLITDYHINLDQSRSLSATSNQVSQFLRSAASDSNFKNQYAVNTQEILQPSVVKVFFFTGLFNFCINSNIIRFTLRHIKNRRGRTQPNTNAPE
jgi:hypothetical protein